MLDHALDEPANDMHSGPVTPVDNDISFAAILGELLGEVVHEVALLDGGSASPHAYILEASASSLVSSTRSWSSSCIFYKPIFK